MPYVIPIPHDSEIIPFEPFIEVEPMNICWYEGYCECYTYKMDRLVCNKMCIYHDSCGLLPYEV